MNLLRNVRRSIGSLVILGLIAFIPGGAHAAPARQAGTQTGGTGRQGDGQPLRVMVMANGAPVSHAQVVITGSDGSVIVSGKTKANGTFVTTSLSAGTYTVTATKLKATANSPVTIVQSTDPAVVSLTIQ
jgi:hypothetical protein